MAITLLYSFDLQWFEVRQPEDDKGTSVIPPHVIYATMMQSASLSKPVRVLNTNQASFLNDGVSGLVTHTMCETSLLS